MALSAGTLTEWSFHCQDLHHSVARSPVCPYSRVGQGREGRLILFPVVVWEAGTHPMVWRPHRTKVSSGWKAAESPALGKGRRCSLPPPKVGTAWRATAQSRWFQHLLHQALLTWVIWQCQLLHTYHGHTGRLGLHPAVLQPSLLVCREGLVPELCVPTPCS